MTEPGGRQPEPFPPCLLSQSCIRGRVMEIKLSCADFTFPLIPLEVCLRLIAGLGIPAVDVSVFTGGPFITPEDVLGNARGTAARLTGLLEQNRLAVADVFPTYVTQFDEPAALNSRDVDERERQRRNFYRYLEFALMIGAPGMTLLPGVAWPEESLEDSLQRAAEELLWRIELTEPFGMKLSVEPHTGSVIDTPEKIARLLDLAPGLSLTLDYGHFVYAGFPEQELERFIPQTRHIHCRQTAPGVMQARVNEGTIDFERLVEACAAAGYTGYFALEYVWMEKWDCNRVDNLSETVLLRDRLRRAAASP